MAKADGFRTFCFHLWNMFTGYQTHISFREALRPSGRREKVMAALRNADAPRVMRFRK